MILKTPEWAYVFGTWGKDLKPSSISDITQDASPDADNVSTLYTAGTNMCTEMWTLNTPYTACVKWSGKVSRLLSTLDTTGDIILTYRTYTMQAFAGSDNAASVAPDYFGSKVVDFAYF